MVRDDDFDRRRAGGQTDLDVAVERARINGREALVEAERKRSPTTPWGCTGQTVAQGLGAWTQGLAVAHDPIAETELQVRKAREIIARLAASQPQRKKELESELCSHLESATKAAALAASRPNGREVATTVLELIAEAQSYLASTSATGRATASSDPIAVAQRGVAGPGGRLPHYDVVQRAFGAHDLSAVRAHVGGAAADASRELGAQAYTHGDHIAFATEPTVQLVAHEATHVVQQRAGVSLKGIDSGTTNPHEHHADAVASAVMRGESAVPLLDNQPSLGSGSTQVVQRKNDGATSTTSSASPTDHPGLTEKDFQGPQTAAAYFAYNEARFLEAVRARLAVTQLPAPHDRLVWTAGSVTLGAAIPEALHKEAGAGMDLAHRLSELLHPVDPWLLIDLHRDISSGSAGETIDGRPAMGTTAWSNTAGMAFALEVEAALRQSLPRMGLRYVAQADDYAGPVPPELLVASHPFDRVVADLLCNPAVARFVPGSKSHGKRATDARTAFKDGLRLVTIEWQGDRDPKLWNWVRATPADATAEEVAASIFERGDGRNHTEYAYALVASPPFFRVPPMSARELPGAKEHAPSSAQSVESAEANSSLDLADSPDADDAAKQQAGKPAAKVNIDQVRDALDTSRTQLELASDRLASWKLGHLVGPALRWVNKRRDALLATPTDTLRAWASILAAQATTLDEALGELIEVLDVVTSARVQPGTREAKPFKDVIEAFAIAMGESQLAQAAATQLATAKRMKAALPLTLLDRSMLETRQASHELAESGGAPKEVTSIAKQTSDSLEASALEVHAKAASGGEVKATDLEALTVAASEASLRTRIWTLRTKLEQLQGAADSATDGGMGTLANIGGSIWDLKRKLVELQPVVWGILETMQKEAVPSGPLPTDNAQAQGVFADTRKAAVERAQGAFARLHEDYKLDALFHEALDTISVAQRRTTYVTLAIEIAALLGISVVGGVVGNAVGGLVRGALLADAATETAAFARTATAARWAGAAANVATDSAVQAVGQTALFGGNTKLSFVENVMTNLMTLGVLRPFHGLAGELGTLDKQAQGIWKVVSAGKVVLVETGTLTMETLVAAGASYVAARLVEGQPPPSEDTAIAWAMQGASMAVGKFVHGKLQDLTGRWSHVPEEKVHFLKRARAQEQLANALEKSGSTEAAMRLLEEHVRILEDEHALLQDSKAIAKLGLDAGQVQTLRAGNDAARVETSSQAYEVMKLRFLGLEPIAANGLVWSGNRAQVELVLADVGGAVKNVQPAGENRWTAEIGGQRVTLVEIDRAPAPDHVPTAAEAEMHRAMAREAIGVNEQRSKQATAKIFSEENPKVKHITVGEGVAGTLSHATQQRGAGARPGPINELPESIAISENPDWWQILGDRDIGQPVGEWKSKGYRWQPGAFNPERKTLGRASDVAYANAMTALETGMVTVRGQVTAVEEFKVGAEPWPIEAKWRLRINGKKWVYTDSVALAGGLGQPRKHTALKPNIEHQLRETKRMTDAQTQLVPRMPEGGTLLVIGGGGTAGWAAQEAVRTGRRAIIVTLDASLGGVPPHVRKELDAHGVRIIEGKVDDATLEGSRVVLTVNAASNDPIRLVGDGVSLAIGQTANLPRGLEDQHFRMQTKVVNGKERVVGLEAYDPSTDQATGLVVQGAEMTTAPFKRGPKPFVKDRDKFVTAIETQAKDPSVPEYSRGVEPSIHQSAVNVPLSNEDSR